ncbi:HepT-like ribonuclease domain-containing protein [Isoptericola croceus]|uniref:HepT-like ribonuclease domain-containing protein n=1 Tax=Isoptericola croceus TaxID=3031406 RepID=UPI0023F950F3|nr:HepT-like ribonuclease domain-containing protein [Isoptericola croceus]
MNDVNERELLPEGVAADLVDLGDALDACGALVERGKEAYASDEMLRYAAEALCNRMGEAVQRLDAGWRETMPGVPWRAIRDNRNVVVHAYRGIDYDELWRTLTIDVPAVREALRSVVGQARRQLVGAADEAASRDGPKDTPRGRPGW